MRGRMSFGELVLTSFTPVVIYRWNLSPTIQEIHNNMEIYAKGGISFQK